MISKMSFGIEKQLACLRVLGRVFTVRDIDYQADTAIVPQLKNEKVQRRKIATFRYDYDLEPYLRESGFAEVVDWWDMIDYRRTSATERRPYFLYRVWRRGGLPKKSKELSDFLGE